MINKNCHKCCREAEYLYTIDNVARFYCTHCNLELYSVESELTLETYETRLSDKYGE